MNTQLILGISPRDDATFRNFYSIKNEQVVASLQHLAAGQGEQFIYVWGRPGAGVSHLLQACCLEASQRHRQSIYLPLSDKALMPEVLTDLETLELICLDNVSCRLNQRSWCEALFHLYNRVRETNTSLIIAASAPPASIECELADLRSRLCWGLTFQVHTLTDEEKLKALQLRAKQRGFELPSEVGLFILRHFSRNMSELYQVLQEIDEASLAAKRRLTVRFVKQVLMKKYESVGV